MNRNNPSERSSLRRSIYFPELLGYWVMILAEPSQSPPTLVCSPVTMDIVPQVLAKTLQPGVMCLWNSKASTSGLRHQGSCGNHIAGSYFKEIMGNKNIVQFKIKERKGYKHVIQGNKRTKNQK